MLTTARFLALAVALGALPALAQSNDGLYKAKTFTQNLTGSAPSAADDGIELAGMVGWSVTVSAPSGQTITGGSLTCYFYAPVSSTGGTRAAVTRRWTPCDSRLNITPTTGVRDPPSLNFVTYVRSGRIAYVPNAITLSGAGTTVDVTIEVRKAP